MKDKDYHKIYAVKPLDTYIRNKVNAEMRKAKLHYYRQKIDACKATDPKMGWKIINSLTDRGNKTTVINDNLINDRIILTIMTLPNQLMISLLRTSGQC